MSRTIPPVPGERSTQEFERVVAAGGWELVELLYGSRSDLNVKWKHLTGAQTRRQIRRAAA